MRVGGAATPLLNERVDVLESYRDKKGHPKDTPGSGRRNAITIDIGSLDTRLPSRYASMTMLDFKCSTATDERSLALLWKHS
jgi:hypothetical protein